MAQIGQQVTDGIDVFDVHERVALFTIEEFIVSRAPVQTPIPADGQLP